MLLQETRIILCEDNIYMVGTLQMYSISMCVYIEFVVGFVVSQILQLGACSVFEEDI